ncbi:MAG: hypothetical protein B6I36_11000, partial [Desulfobacteraceae bacterium 4572_35.1]
MRRSLTIPVSLDVFARPHSSFEWGFFIFPHAFFALWEQVVSTAIELVTTQTVTIEHELRLESGRLLGPLTIAYETYGELNAQGDNAILVTHAWTGDAHAAGRHHEDDRKPGWWDNLIGPGKVLDTDKYQVICSNVIGSCKGSTGPTSINPATGRPYRLNFPIVMVRDMVRAQKLLMDEIGVTKLVTVIGGSMGA